MGPKKTAGPYLAAVFIITLGTVHAAPVIYEISGSLASIQDLIEVGADNFPSGQLWNPQGDASGSSFGQSCPGALFSCTNTAATGDAIGVGQFSGGYVIGPGVTIFNEPFDFTISEDITGTVRPTFTGTLSIDSLTGTVVMDMTFDGTVVFRNKNFLDNGFALVGSAVSELTNWRQVVTWTQGTVGQASGSVIRGLGTSSGAQVCDWNTFDDGQFARNLCNTRQADAADRSWGTTVNQISGSGLPDCTGTPTSTGNYTPCESGTLALGGATGDTELEYTVSGNRITGYGTYLERGWNTNTNQAYEFAYGLCTAADVSVNQFACGSRWEGALQSRESANSIVGDTLFGGSITFSGTLKPVPAPAPLILLGTALGLLGWCRRRRA